MQDDATEPIATGWVDHVWRKLMLDLAVNWLKWASGAAAATVLSYFGLRYLKRDRPSANRIMITGPAGVGKSTLYKLMTECLPGGPDGKYQATIRTQTAKACRPWPEIEVVDVPGQEVKQVEIEESLARIDRGEFSGLVFMTSWGIHSLGTVSPRSTSYWPKNGNITTFKKTYHQVCREREKVFAIALTSRLNSCPVQRDLWVLHVINKADLWDQNQNDIATFYNQSAFNKLEEALKRHGGAFVRMEVCLMPASESDSEGRTLYPSSPAFDQSTSKVTLRQLCDKIVELSKGKQ